MAQITPSDLNKLLENKGIPGSHQDLQVLSAWIEDIIQAKGERYIKQNRKRLLKSWKEILKFGLTKI